MIRKLLLVAVLAAAWTMAGHNSLEPNRATAKEDKKAALYVHTVIFYLNKDAPKDAASDMIADAHELLAKIPSVREVRAGRPAEKATPTFAKNDYQVGLLVLFDDADGLKTYLEHPLHLKYVEKHLKHVDEKKLLVYDFVNQAK
jgi:hypothetical protein